MFNANANGFSAKFLNRMFRKINGLVWDLQSGNLGIKNEHGIHTLTVEHIPATLAVPASEGFPATLAQPESTNYGISVNPFDAFGFSIPAFATQVPLANIRPGDLIVGDRDILGWVVGRTPQGLRLLDKNGMNKNYTPPKVAVLGQDGALVVQSLGGLFGGQAGVAGLQSQLLPLLALSDGNSEGLESILPLILFSQLQQTNPAAASTAAAVGGNPALAQSPIASFLPMLLLSQGKNKTRTGKSGGMFGDMDPMMAMMAFGGGFGGGQAGGINPMMLMMLAKNGGLGGDDGDDVVSVPTTHAGTGFTAPALQAMPKARSARSPY